jgi:hypothetical protein
MHAGILALSCGLQQFANGPGVIHNPHLAQVCPSSESSVSLFLTGDSTHDRAGVSGFLSSHGPPGNYAKVLWKLPIISLIRRTSVLLRFGESTTKWINSWLPNNTGVKLFCSAQVRGWCSPKTRHGYLINT